MKTLTLAAVACALGPAAASAQPIDLTVDPALSSIDVTIAVTTALGVESDSDTSALGGTAQIELDDPAAISTITLNAFEFTAQENLNFLFDYGFLGSITGTGTGLGLRSPAGATPTSGMVDGAGAFVLADVPTESFGVVETSGSGVVGDLAGSSTIDLSTLAPTPVEVVGEVSVAGGIATVTVTVPISAVQDVASGVTATITGTATVVATGPVPDEPCVADTNGDGLLTLADFNGWIIAFNTQSPACDQNGDGLCTPADFNGWIINFNAGC